MTKKDIAKKYLQFLRKGATQDMLALFAEDAMVYSPVYGAKRPGVFYGKLFEDTRSSAVTLNGIFEENASGRLALYFNYEWTLKNGKTVRFDVVDIIRFNPSNKIIELKILYDSAAAGALVREMDDAAF